MFHILQTEKKLLSETAGAGRGLFARFPETGQKSPARIS